MKQLTKKLLSMLLTLALLLQLLPASIFATEGDGDALTEAERLLIDEGSFVAADETPAEILFEEVALREENVKHFRMSDGSYRAVVYDTPVHYLDEDGQWQEYDNTLQAVSTLDGDGVSSYRVENGDSVRLFAADAASEQLLLVQTGEYSLALTPALPVDAELLVEPQSPAEAGAAAVQAAQPNQETPVTAEVMTAAAPAEEVITDSFFAQAQPEKLYSALEYDALLDGATLRYENYANSIKESIVIDAPQDEYIYQFRMQVIGLTPALLDDGSIVLTSNSGETVYSIPAPYMIDANDEVSYDAAYTLESSGSDWLLTVTADAQWMNAAERAYPVLLDPTVTETADSADDISAAYVRSGYPDSPDTTDTGLYVGNNNNVNQKTRSYFHINNLPVLPAGCELTGASFGIYQYSYDGSSSLDIGLYALTAATYSGNSINGLTATATWKNWAGVLTWNKVNGASAAHSTLIVDRQSTGSANNRKYLEFDITKLAFGWYDSENNGEGGYKDNLGFMLMPVSEGSASSRATFYGPKKTSNRPRITIEYRNVRGIEPDYTYQTAAIGRAGTAYIGDFSMQNTLVVPLTGSSSDTLPFSVSLVYNSDMTGRYFSGTYDSIHTKNFDSMKTGIGWKLSLQETIVPLTVGGQTYLVYTDSDGTEHYYTNDNGTYIEKGENTRLTITGTSSEYTLSDEYGGRKIFTNCYLTATIDAYGNALYYCYDGVNYSSSSTAWKPSSTGAHKITSVWRVNNGVAAEKLLSLEYDTTNGVLTGVLPKCNVSEAANYRVQLAYENRDGVWYLSTITYPDGAKAQYTYLPEDSHYWDKNRLAAAYDTEANYGVEFGYSYTGNVREIYEYVLNGNEKAYGAKLHGYKRAHSLAVYRDYGKDQTAGNSDDYLTFKVLDRTGRTVCAYTTDASEQHILGSSAAAYTSGSSRKANNLLSASAYTAQPGVNLLRNSGAEDNGSWWSAVSTSTAVAYSGSRSFILNNNAFYQIVTLSAGNTYTFSAYVNMPTAGGVVQLALLDTSGNILAASTPLTTSTAGVNGGWQRLSATYTVGSSNVDVMASMVSSGLSGNVYVDCLQLEAEDAPSTYNLVENGSFDQPDAITTSVPTIGWYYTGNASVTTSGNPHFGSKTLQINGADGVGRVSQEIPLNAPAGSTFLLSGWGKADALPGSVAEKSENSQPYFGLVARLYYEGNAPQDSDVFYFPFDPYNGNWQQRDGILVPSEENADKVISSVIIVAAYDNNINTAYFDNISLRREPAQTYRYDENGNPVSATQSETGSESATYAANGVDLTGYTAANGAKYTYEYNAAHDVTSASVAGITSTTTYNDAGNVTGSSLTKTDDANAPYMQSTATPTGNKNHTASVTDANGSTTEYGYHPYTGQTTSVENANGVVSNYVYDVRSGRQSQVYQDGVASITYGYSRGVLATLDRKTFVQEADGTTQELHQIYNFAYNLWGQPTTTKVGTRTLSTNTYYNFGGTGEGVGGNLKTTTYGNGQGVSYTYDKLDRLVRTEYTGGRYITYAYNSEGQLSKLTYGDGSAVTASYLFEYDSLGRLVRSRKQDGNGGVKLRTEHIYDAYNRLSSQSWVLGTKAYSESYAYSDGENGDGSITRMTTATGATIDYTYDTLKRLQQTMVKAANGTPLLTTAYAYRNVNAQQTTAQIEFRNVRLGENGSVLEGKKYTYDALGNITEVSQSADPYNVLVKYEYDAQNQLVSEIYYDGSGSATANITVAYYYTYDTAGNLLQVEKGTVHAGVLIRSVHQTYTYSTGDWKDLLESVTTDGTACSITYDGSGNPTAYGNWAFSWQNGRQLFEAQADTDTTHTGLSYAYDAEGIRTSKTYTVETWENIPQYTVTFVADGTTVKTMTVDDGYVLQSSDYPTVPPKAGYTGTWNSYTSAIHSNITIQATYTVVATHTVVFRAGGKTTVKTMTVNDGYVLKSSDYPAVPPRLGYTGRWNRYTSPIHSDITITATYTQGGGIEIPIDPTEPPVIMSLEDEDDAAVSVGEQETPAEVQETAELSGDRTGQRLVSTQTVQHDYLTLGGRVARETITTDGTVTAVLDFIYDSQGRPFALNYSTNGGSSFTTYYYVLNLQGDVVKLISYIPGFEYEEVASYTYDAWGNIISATGEKAELNPLRYRGYYYDSETGFYYLQSRYYDPVTHRFINADVYTSTDSTDAISCNMFAYCGNNPVLFEDPNGELGIIAVSLLFAGVSALVDYGMQVISNYENGYTGKEAWVDNISFGSVASAAFSGAIAPSTLCIGSALADFILSPAIELSVDYVISPSKNEPLTLESYTIKQMERFGDTCVTEIINGAISGSYQNPLTDDAIQSTIKGMTKSNTVNTIWSTIKSFIMTVLE